MKHILIFVFFYFFSLSLFGQNTADLEVVVEDLRNEQGKIGLSLFNDSDGFPEDNDRAFRWKTVNADNEKVVFYFRDLRPGEYAYAILHDEDGNGEMKKSVFGIPKEGFGFSNNYKPKIKNPSFEDASFSLKPGMNKHVVEIIYF